MRELTGAASPSGKARVCKTRIPGSNPGAASNFQIGYFENRHGWRNRFCKAVSPTARSLLIPDLSFRISHLGSLNFDRCSLNIGGRFRQKNFWQADFVPDQRSDASFWISGV